MEFYAHHGCFVEERHIGTAFKVDLVVEYDATKAAKTDDIHYAVNYQSIYEEVNKIMKTPANLLETISQKILSMIENKFPQVDHAEVTVYKMNPVLGGKTSSVSVNNKF